ncbi:MAG: DUF4258 domain-containing protein [Deltaproteobacteria bacterium]|nr:DUF4258 domain-containing protein [Deltaproteobacteria bacterium]
MNLAKLREALNADNIQWERHVLERLISRNISRLAVRQILRSGECIEDYPDDYDHAFRFHLFWFILLLPAGRRGAIVASMPRTRSLKWIFGLARRSE